MTPTLETSRLYFEPLDVDKHLQDWHDIWSNPDAVIWSSKPKFETIEASKDWLLFQLPNEINTEIDKFAIFLKDSIIEKEETVKDDIAGEKTARPKMIGFVGTNRWSDNQNEKVMEVGYCFNVDYWGKGYATESFAAFLNWLWAQPQRKNINKLLAKTSPGNIGSQKVVIKCGGVKGEIIKDGYSRFVDNGVKSDILCWYFDRPVTVEVKK